MEGGIYQIIVIAVGVYALFRGYHSGLSRQICGILGFAFATVFSYLFSGDVAGILAEVVPSFLNYPFPPFIYSIVASSLVYSGVYLIVKYLTGVLRYAMKVFHVGMLDRLLGCAFCLFKYMVCLSLIYNLILCFKPDSSLLAYSRADDGNMVAGVLMLAPDLLGCVNVEDLSHALQLIDAKKISCNFRGGESVIGIKDRQFYTKAGINRQENSNRINNATSQRFICPNRRQGDIERCKS